MALPPLASVTDLSAWVGRDISVNDPRAGAVLSHASTRVRTYTKQTWVTETGALGEVPDAVRDVVVRMAARVWRNPEDLESVTVDSDTKRWGVGRGLVLTDVDREDLDDYRVAATPFGIATVSTTRGSDDTGTIYVPTAPAPSGDPFPWYDSTDPLLG